MGTSSCWHGVTSVVLGNCGVTFAPVAKGGKETLAEMMESVEDIPRDAILNGLPWDWTSYGGYLDWVDRIPKGLNVGGMVGHCAVRLASMGDRSLAETPATADDIDAMCAHVDEAMASGALGFQTSRTCASLLPVRTCVTGTSPPPMSLCDGTCLAAGAGVRSASRLGERDSDDLPTLERGRLMGEVAAARAAGELRSGQSSAPRSLLRVITLRRKRRAVLRASRTPPCATRLLASPTPPSIEEQMAGAARAPSATP